MATHIIRTHKQNFNAIKSRIKDFECIDNILDFKAEDTVYFDEWDDELNQLTQRRIEVMITYVLKDNFPGLAPGYGVFSFIFIRSGYIVEWN